MTTKMLKLDDIRIDGNTQPRAAINMDVVNDYKAAYEAMADMPAVDVMYDGVDFWLYDGYHRYHGRRGAGLDSIEATIHKGTQRDAILASLKANQAHGLRRSNADKRKAVETLLADPEWSKESNNWLAEQAGVSHTLVNEMRDRLEAASSHPPATTRKGKDGRAINTAKIGRKPKAKDGTSATDGAAGTQADAGTATEGEGGTDAPAGPPLDLAGNPIEDPAIAAVFADGRLTDIAKRLRALRLELKDIADEPVGAWLSLQAITLDLSNAESAVEWAQPYAVTPKHVRTNDRYVKVGWLNREAWNALPGARKGKA